MQEIVIKIPMPIYKAFMEDYTNTTDVLQAVRKGILLPKGHGRLKDFDKIEWYGCDFEGKPCSKVNGDCEKCDYANCSAKQVRELPTIIEADKEDEE